MAMSPDFLCQSWNPSLILQETVSLMLACSFVVCSAVCRGLYLHSAMHPEGCCSQAERLVFSLSPTTTAFPAAFAFSDVHLLPVLQHSEGIWHQQNTGRNCIRFNLALMVQVPLGFEQCYVGEEERFDFNERWLGTSSITGAVWESRVKELIHILFTEVAVKEHMLNVHSSLILLFLFTVTNNVFPFSFEWFINLELMMNMQFTLQRHWNHYEKADLRGVHSTLWSLLWLLISQAFRGTCTILATALAYSSLLLLDKCDIQTSRKHIINVWLL